MARRISGTYSPQAKSGTPPGPPNPPQVPVERRVSPVGARVNLLFAVPFLFALSAFFRDPAGLAANLGVFALLMLSAWLTREGVIAQDAFDRRRVARRPAIPRKIFASVAMGLGLGLAGFVGGGVANAVIFAALGAGLHLAAFGLDPLRDKGMEGVDLFQTDRVARAISEAEDHLSAMTDAARRIRDRQVEARLGEFQTHARALFRTVENDPRRLSAARRYLGVYLLGAREATVKFADLFARTRDEGAKTDFIALLDDLQKNFALRTESLLDNDRQALDIEMDVLRERLEREGLRSETIANATPAPSQNTDPAAPPLRHPEKGNSDV